MHHADLKRISGSSKDEGEWSNPRYETGTRVLAIPTRARSLNVNAPARNF